MTREPDNALAIRRLFPDEPLPYDLLYSADPYPRAVDDYVQRGEVFLAIREGQTVGVCVLLHTRPLTMEIVNLAVDEKRQRQGIGKKLIERAIEEAARAGAQTLEVGTGNSGGGQLIFYQKCGFSITGIDFDFFRRHYPEKIVENGIECRHMIRMNMIL